LYGAITKSKSFLLNTLLLNTLYAIFSGPIVNTLCTAVINLDEQILSIIEGNPKKGEVSHVFTMSSKEFKMPR